MSGLTTLHLHRIVSVRFEPPKASALGATRALLAVDESGHDYEIVLYSERLTNLCLLTVEERHFPHSSELPAGDPAYRPLGEAGKRP